MLSQFPACPGAWELFFIELEVSVGLNPQTYRDISELSSAGPHVSRSWFSVHKFALGAFCVIIWASDQDAEHCVLQQLHVNHPFLPAEPGGPTSFQTLWQTGGLAHAFSKKTIFVPLHTLNL